MRTDPGSARRISAGACRTIGNITLAAAPRSGQNEILPPSPLREAARPPAGTRISLTRQQDSCATLTARGLDELGRLSCADGYAPAAVRGGLGGAWHFA